MPWMPSTAMTTNQTEHHRSENLPDEARALLLHDEQPDEDGDGERHDDGRERRRIHLQAFDGAEHGDRRRDRAVAVEQGRADQADDQELGAPGAGRGIAGVQQRQQGDDAAFAAIVGTQDQQRILDRDDQDQRPQDQRGHAQNRIRGERTAVSGGLGGFLQARRGGWCRCRHRRRRAHRMWWRPEGRWRDASLRQAWRSRRISQDKRAWIGARTVRRLPANLPAGVASL